MCEYACVCLAVVRISPCHSRQPSVISDASAADGDRSSTPSDINSPRHRTHSLCNVRAAWPPRPSNHTSTIFCLCLPFHCFLWFVCLPLSCQPNGFSLPAHWWWSYLKGIFLTLQKPSLIRRLRALSNL